MLWVYYSIMNIKKYVNKKIQIIFFVFALILVVVAFVTALSGGNNLLGARTFPRQERLKENRAVTGQTTTENADNLVTPIDTSTLVTTKPVPVTKINLVQRFQDAGYLVQQGQYRFFKQEDCLTMISSGMNCLGNNPASPYGRFFVLPAPGEYIDTAYDVPGLVSLPYRSQWRMRQDEAFVFIGTTPASAKYFGYQSYLSNRLASKSSEKAQPGTSEYLKDLFYGPSLNPSRRDLYASLGDSINYESIRPQSGDPYSKQIAIITSASQDVDNAMRNILIADGIPTENIFSDKIPNSVKIGLDANADMLTFLGRFTPYSNDTNARAYIDNPPVAIYRVTPQVVSKPKRYGAAKTEARSGNSESDLKKAMDTLKVAVEKANSGWNKKETSNFIALSFLEGSKCINKTMNCLGDTRDTTYAVSSNYPLVGQDKLIIIGVNHKETGNASYVGLSAYNPAKLMGVGGVTEEKLKGTVDKYLAYVPANDPGRDSLITNKDKFFVYSFSLSCAEENCFQLNIGNLGLDPDGLVNFAVRAYLKPGTKRGPSYDKLLYPALMKFSKN